MKGIYDLKAKQHDTIEDIKTKNDKLINMVKKLEKKCQSLDTKNTTLQRAFNKTEVFLREVTDSVSLLEMLEHVKEGRPLRRLTKQCPVCSDKKLKKLQFKGFYVVLCSNCNYRKKIDIYDESEEEAQ